ncbi:MAG TPA: hypothetical protein VIK30_09210 [Polyangia bacterium]
MAVWGLCAGAWAHAAAPDDDIDDPKVARRLGSRIDWTSPPSATPPSTPPAVATPPPAVPAVATPPPAVPIVAPPPAPAVATSPALAPASASAAAEAEFDPVLPRVELAFRRFDFVQIGASESASSLAKSEAFDTLSLDVYPLSSLVRVGLSTAYGWQAGKTSDGDYFASETASLGVQIKAGHVVPFAEGLAGIGYMRRFQFEHTIPTVLWQFGIDAGAALYLARIGFVSVALGYLHPVNGFLKTTTFESIYTNTWSIKIGIGL